MALLYAYFAGVVMGISHSAAIDASVLVVKVGILAYGVGRWALWTWRGRAAAASAAGAGVGGSGEVASASEAAGAQEMRVATEGRGEGPAAPLLSPADME